MILEVYEEQMKGLKPRERLSLELEWEKKRADVMEEYMKHKSEKNIIQEFMRSMMETEYTDKSGKVITLAESLIQEAIKNEKGNMDFKKLDTLMKLLGNTEKKVVVSGGLTLSAKARELSK